MNTIFCYKKIDSNNYNFLYDIKLKDEFLSHLHYFKGSIYTFLFNKKNDILKVKKCNTSNSEIVLTIEDQIFRIFSTIDGRKNYTFSKESLIFCDYANRYLKVFNINNKMKLDTFMPNFNEDTTLNKVFTYTKKYKIYGNGNDYLKATDLLDTKNLLFSIHSIDTFILINISNSGYSKRDEKFVFLNKLGENNLITQINSYNTTYPLESDTINSFITFKNAPLFFHSSNILIKDNKFICPVFNISKNELDGNYKLNDLFKFEENTNALIKKYYFFIYELSSNM